MILKSKSFMHSENLKTEFLNRKNKLMQSLSNFNENQLVSAEESKKLLHEISELQHIVSATVFFNAEIPIMNQEVIKQNEPEQISSVTETESVKTEISFVEDSKVGSIEIVEKTETLEITVVEEPTKENQTTKEEVAVVEVKETTTTISSVNVETTTPKPSKPIKKMEIGINDKFRIMNELFGQSQLEYSTALEQLNLCENLEESENYLNNLSVLYQWKQDAPLVKTLFAINHKRFI
jgi:hypothetical protein